MPKLTEFNETKVIKTTHECDVLVAGGGVAGIAAALAAARSGKSVILLERGYMLGGPGCGPLWHCLQPCICQEAVLQDSRSHPPARQW